QFQRQGRGDRGAAAKTHNGHADGYSAPVGKPFDECGYGRDVTDAQPNAAQDPVAEIDQPQLVQLQTERRHQKAAAKAAGSSEHGLARPYFFQTFAGKGGRQAKKNNGNTEHPAQFRNGPVIGGGFGNTQQLGHWFIEYGKGISLSDT